MYEEIGKFLSFKILYIWFVIIYFPYDIRSTKSRTHPKALRGWVHRSGRTHPRHCWFGRIVELELAAIAQCVLELAQPPAQPPVQPSALPFIEVDQEEKSRHRFYYARSGDERPSRPSAGKARSGDTHAGHDRAGDARAGYARSRDNRPSVNTFNFEIYFSSNFSIADGAYKLSDSLQRKRPLDDVRNLMS